MTDYSWAIGNHHIWEQLVKHISNTSIPIDGKLSLQACLFIFGASGIGKTYNVKKLTNDGFNVYRIDSTNCTNAKEFKDMLVKGCNPYLMTRNGNADKSLIIIDDIDILCHMDRTLMNTFLEILSNKSYTLSYIPIVCIGLLEMQKKLGVYRLKCKVCICCAPTDTDIFMFLKTQDFCKKKTKKYLMTIAEDCNGNLNRAFELAKGNMLRTATIFETKECSRINHIRYMMSEDPWMTPLRFHENIPKFLPTKNRNIVYGYLLDSFCIWDKMMNNNEQDTDMCIDILSYSICRWSTFQETMVLEDFTKLLSNMSLQKKMDRQSFPSWDHGFSWPHAQIFCEYSKQKWTT